MSEKKQKTFFVTNHDVGGAQALIPVAQRLAARGDRVITFAKKYSPAFSAFEQVGLKPRKPQDYGEVVLNPFTLHRMMKLETYDGVIVGLSGDGSSDRMALQIALEEGIPSFVILETWPKRWLDIRKSSDVPLHGRASAICVPDDVSREIMLRHGFDGSRVIVTGNPCNDTLGSFKRERARYRSDMRRRLGFRVTDTVVLWCVTENLDDAEAQRPGNPTWLGASEVELVTEYLKAMHEFGGGDFQGFIRQKPTYSTPKIHALIDHLCPSVRFDNLNLERGIPSLLAADIVFGQATIVVQTAALLGIPAVYYMPNLDREDPMITNALGLTVLMRESGELCNTIRSLSMEPERTLARIASAMRPMNLSENATGAVVAQIDCVLAAR